MACREPYLATGVRVLSELHAITPHQAMQRDEDDVQPIDATLENILDLFRVLNWRCLIVLLQPVNTKSCYYNTTLLWA